MASSVLSTSPTVSSCPVIEQLLPQCMQFRLHRSVISKNSHRRCGAIRKESLCLARFSSCERFNPSISIRLHQEPALHPRTSDTISRHRSSDTFATNNRTSHRYELSSLEAVHRCTRNPLRYTPVFPSERRNNGSTCRLSHTPSCNSHRLHVYFHSCFLASLNHYVNEAARVN